MFTPKSTVSAHEAAIAKSQEKFAALKTQRDSALSTFRSAAGQLATVNDQLAIEINEACEMMDFYAAQKEAATAAIADNKAVIDHIFAIIGK